MLAKHRLGYYMPDYDMSMIISTKLGVLEMVPPDSIVACEELLLLVHIPEVQTHHLPPILTYLQGVSQYFGHLANCNFSAFEAPRIKIGASVRRSSGRRSGGRLLAMT